MLKLLEDMISRLEEIERFLYKRHQDDSSHPYVVYASKTMRTRLDLKFYHKLLTKGEDYADDITRK